MKVEKEFKILTHVNEIKKILNPSPTVITTSNMHLDFGNNKTVKFRWYHGINEEDSFSIIVKTAVEDSEEGAAGKKEKELKISLATAESFLAFISMTDIKIIAVYTIQKERSQRILEGNPPVSATFDICSFAEVPSSKIFDIAKAEDVKHLKKFYEKLQKQAGNNLRISPYVEVETLEKFVSLKMFHAMIMNRLKESDIIIPDDSISVKSIASIVKINEKLLKEQRKRLSDKNEKVFSEHTDKAKKKNKEKKKSAT